MAGLASLALVASASAGEYHVYSCRTPSGESAPTEGWSGSKTGAYDNYAEDTCAKGGALIAALGELTTHITNTDMATWTFSVPAGDVMKGTTLWRAGDADGEDAFNATYEFWLAGPNEADDTFDECVYQAGCTTGRGDTKQPLSEANRVVVPGANLGSHLYLNASCAGISNFECPSGHGDANHYAAVVELYAADITLEQTEGPSASNVSGELASAGTVSGSSDVAFDASDPGAGVWEAVFSVEGQVVQSTVLERKRRALQERGPDDGRAAGVPVLAAVPADGERGCPVQHDGVEQRRAPPRRQRARRGRQRGARARQGDRRR